MKTPLLSLVLFAMSSFTNQEDKTNEKGKIEQLITDFVKAADMQDHEKMDSLLDPNFSSIRNRLFGSESTSTTSRATYLQLLKEKKIGGDERKVTILSTEVMGNNACVKAIFEGKKLTFQTFLLPVKNTSNQWKVVCDFPTVTPKE